MEFQIYLCDEVSYFAMLRCHLWGQQVLLPLDAILVGCLLHLY